jgi:hypothetical protein
MRTTTTDDDELVLAEELCLMDVQAVRQRD